MKLVNLFKSSDLKENTTFSNDEKQTTTIEDYEESNLSSSDYISKPLSLSSDSKYTTHRNLKPRHIDLIAIGGSIGTGLFVTIGQGLLNGGCGNLLLAFCINGFIVYVVTLSIGELICYLPLDSPFITHAGRFVDPAFEFCCGLNFYLMISLYIPFEITSVNSMIHFWRDDYSPATAIVPQIVIYLLLNIFTVRWFGESEFYLSVGKMFLAVGLIMFTFVTMVGGNPQNDAFGFKNFKGVANAFPEYLGSGASAFWAAYLKAIFTEVAPEFLGMVAGEAANPRKTMPRAFKTIIYRLAFFYVLGALSVGVILNREDPTLIQAVAEGAPGANVSPYVIAMRNMKIKVLPDIVNVLCITSSFSAGNSYVYCSSRALFALAQRGLAPKIFRVCLKNGVPVYALLMAIAFSCLSLLQLGSAASFVLSWMINLCTSGQVLNYFLMMVTYLHFYRACKVQHLDRRSMPLQTWCTRLQPFPAIFAMISEFVVIIFLGCPAFIHTFDINSFLYCYLMIFISIVSFTIYKLVFKTKYVKPEEADMFSGLAEIEEYEKKYYAQLDGQIPDKSIWVKLKRRFWW